MDHDFWHARWQRSETGFHLPRVNPWLEKQFAALAVREGDHVFLPLCGKSLDLRWLADRGLRVTGIELSALAVEAFFTAQGLAPSVRDAGHGLVLHEAGNIRLFCGDFFALTPALLGSVDAVFDRGALVALPPPMRARYAAHLASLATRGARDLLVSFDYAQDEMPGPPFSVPQAEIRQLFGAQFDIAALGRADILDAEPRFRERGLTRLTETCWLLVKR